MMRPVPVLDEYDIDDDVDIVLTYKEQYENNMPRVPDEQPHVLYWVPDLL